MSFRSQARAQSPKFVTEFIDPVRGKGNVATLGSLPPQRWYDSPMRHGQETRSRNRGPARAEPRSDMFEIWVRHVSLGMDRSRLYAALSTREGIPKVVNCRRSLLRS